jgi:uncharacterized Zn-binding protein involved in type VI secretion
VPADSDSAAQVAKVIARGGQQASAQAQATQQPEDQGSAFDVWTHTGQWQSSSPSAILQSMATQVSGLSKAKDAVGEAEGALATTGAVFSLLTSVEQTLSTPYSIYPFPGFPAVRIGDFAVGFPHAHAHPPNIPFPSFGPVIPIPFLSGASRVLINGMPAARCGDLGIGVWCGGYFPMYEIFFGSSNVWIEGARAARIGVDLTLHCVFSTPKPSDLPIGLSIGTTVTSSPNVLIGGVPMPSLTSLAIGAAFKAVFAGLGKAARAIRQARASADDAARAAARASADDAARAAARASADDAARAAARASADDAARARAGFSRALLADAWRRLVEDFGDEIGALGLEKSADSALLQRYLNEAGGRWGGKLTRQLNNIVATHLEEQGYRITGGAGRGPEEWIPGPGGGLKGGTFVDITAEKETSIIRVQTVTTLADNKTPTPAELAAAARIRRAFPGDQLILIPKEASNIGDHFD